MRQERMLFLNNLKHTLAFARSQSFLKNTTFTLCGSHSKQKCHMQKELSSGYILFENPNQEEFVDGKKIYRSQNKLKYGKIYFTGTKALFHILPSGMTMNIGTFIYCPNPPYNKKEEMDGLVINRVFRSYYLRENQEKMETTECKNIK